MRFANTYFFILLLVIPLIIYRYFYVKRVKVGSIRFSDLGTVKRLRRSFSLRLRHSLIFLRVLVIALLVLAMARPQAGEKDEEILTEGVDIILAIDVSSSMKAEDFKPKNRLHVAKQVVAEFIRGRKNDRLGMVVFAAKSFTQCPLTLDYGIILNFLDQVEIGIIEDGTAIGMAIATCINRLRDSDAKSKVVILLTDGINNRGEIDPITAAKTAQAMDVKIYTIGAGKRGNALYPVDDPIFGRRYVRMPVEIDEETLQEIARLTDAKYYRATDGQALAQIYKEIGEMEKTEIKTKEYVRYTELFWFFLLPAIALLGCEIVLANTRFRKIP
ncbi:MAG: VWA domain-containing protein [Gemmatimonadota bacterium]|nr:MAG: VWA domain-containing protein [Gemmatimonadota bacterium]